MNIQQKCQGYFCWTTAIAGLFESQDHYGPAYFREFKDSWKEILIKWKKIVESETPLHYYCD